MNNSTCKYCGKDIVSGLYCSPCKSIKRKRRLYGLPEIEYEMMLRKQGKMCAICSKKPETLVVDHNHSTDQVRGLLCSECNLGLGKFQDRPDLLDKAHQYLIRYEL